ncbi:PREDICTED: TNF receptor-associated factor 6-like [Amphimedon queenslandica]|uniref:TRAF1-6 MATH domain-containing protein n=1 Tax=Amphimedon queenslandica TaxID=400682 RepID=A0AAN0K3H4_AMPQE|nr:PREDICTED: TNF receptor-associated factor 6-like [Amphimedon queenslandica]|eukprot:XP_019864071.1 PREDICTED: TNF receptor-associated factor 6-like [Amphimedon queenslandica]
MAENEKLQADLVNKKLETDENEETVQMTKLKLTRVPTLHDDWRESHTLPVEVLMTSFASHHKSNDHWYSPSFYSHQEGYKLCLSGVRANGESEGSGTHLSIHIHLMRGDHDETLKWPVRGKVKLELFIWGLHMCFKTLLLPVTAVTW